MPLIRNGKLIDDPYQHILDEAVIPDDGAVIVPAARLLADASDIFQRADRTGVSWPNDRAVRELAPFLDRLSLIALAFPNFRDGRAYSQARILRDQFLFLVRAGFDAFEVTKPADAAAFASTIHRYSIFYQPAADGTLPAFRRRIARAELRTQRVDSAQS